MIKIKFLLLAAAGIIPLAMNSCAPGAYYDAGYSPGYHGGGSYLSVLPYGYRTIHVSGRPYYYHNNSWYHRKNGRYYRTSRPSGYYGNLGRVNNRGIITKLPYGYKTHSIGGNRYYSYGGKWYNRRDGRYYPVSKPSAYKPKPPYGYTGYNKPNFSKPVTFRNSKDNQWKNKKSNIHPKNKTSNVSGLGLGGTRISSGDLGSGRVKEKNKDKDKDKRKNRAYR